MNREARDLSAVFGMRVVVCDGMPPGSVMFVIRVGRGFQFCDGDRSVWIPDEDLLTD